MFSNVVWPGAWGILVRNNSSAQLAGDSRNTCRMLYPGFVKALRYGTTCAVCIPLLLNIKTWPARRSEECYDRWRVFDALFMTMGCTQCMSFVSIWKGCLHLGLKQEYYSTGGGLDRLSLCLLLCFLIFLVIQGGPHSGNKEILVGNRGQLIPWGKLELGHLGLCMLEGELPHHSSEISSTFDREPGQRRV